MPEKRDPDAVTTAALAKLRSEGVPLHVACRRVGVSTRTVYRWKREAEGGLNGEHRKLLDQVFHTKGHPRLEVEAPEWRSRGAFNDWARTLILDTGEPWVPEEWELDAVEDMLAGGFQAVWLVVAEGNGKTTLVAAVVLYLLEHQITPEIPIGSATTTQADTLFRQIEGFIVRSGKLIDFHIAAGLRRIDFRTTHGHVRVYAHNEKSGEGVIPSASVLDEAHLHPNLKLYRIWKGKYKKRKGPVFLISTAGEPTSEFEELRARLIAQADEKKQVGPYIRAVKGSTVIHDWAVRDRKDVEDFGVVAAANPLSVLDAEWFAEKHAEPEMTDAHWLRRTCNIPAREEGQAIESEDYDALIEPDLVPDRQALAFGWIDLGWQIDCTALGVLVWESTTRRVVAGVKILRPPVDEADIVRALVARQREFRCKGWVYDPNAGGRQMAQLLEKGEHPQQEGVEVEFIDHAQTDAPMALATVRMDEAIRNRWMVVGNATEDEIEMRRHWLNAVRKGLAGERSRYAKPPEASGTQGDQRAKYWNDALIGVAMGHSVAVAEAEAPPPPPSEIAQF